MQSPKGIGVTLLIVTIILLTLSCLTLFLRLAVRTWTRQMGADDYLMSAGLVLYAVTCGLVIACCYYGAGQLSDVLLPKTQMMGIKLFFIAEFFYAACTVPIKASICVCLFRIADKRRRFVWTLWAVVGATVTAAIIFIVAIANLCHPITTLWGETTYGTCNTQLNSSVSFYFSAVSILTDLALAILPAILLWNVQMKRRAKASVAIILGLAAFASCATIIRLRYLTLYNNTAEFMYSTGQIGLWSVIEEGIGITAGSMPALGPLLNTRAFGGSRSDKSDQPIKPTASMWRRNMAQRRRIPEDGAPLETLVEGTATVHGNKTQVGKSEETIMEPGSASRRTSDDGDSQKHILRETRITVTHENWNETEMDAEQYKKERILSWDHLQHGERKKGRESG